MTDLGRMVSKNETIMWQGKPNKKCFILESVFNPLLFGTLLWAAADIFIMIKMKDTLDTLNSVSSVTGVNTNSIFKGGALIFFLVHLMPVWIYLFGVIMSFLRYKNTQYIITDRGLYISGGVFTYNYEMKPFTDLSHINLHRGILDRMLGVGDVIVEYGHMSYGTLDTSTNSRYASTRVSNPYMHGFTFRDLEEYDKIFHMISDLQTDIYSDTMYPNDLRSGNNHGYNTKYDGGVNNYYSNNDSSYNNRY